MSRFPIVAAAALIAAAPLATGCGAGGETRPAETMPARSPSAWAVEADAACGRARTELDRLPEFETVAELSAADRRTEEIMQTMRDELAALGPPVDGESAFEAMLAAYDRALREFVPAAAALAELDPDLRLGEVDPDDLPAPLERDLQTSEDYASHLFEGGRAGFRLRALACGALHGTAVALGEMNDSGQTGTAVLLPDGEQTAVAVSLEDAPAGRLHASVYVGTCESLIAAVIEYELADVVDGWSYGTLATTLPELAATLHHYSIVVTGSESDEPVACGTLPGP